MMISCWRQPLNPLLRLALLWLVTVLVAAPMFHVCEEGGQCHSKEAASASGAVKSCCLKKKIKQHCAVKAPPPGFVLTVDDRDEPFSGTCLAKLLQTMPGAIYTAQRLTPTYTPSHFYSPLTFNAPRCAAQRRPPARGPPTLLAV